MLTLPPKRWPWLHLPPLKTAFTDALPSECWPWLHLPSFYTIFTYPPPPTPSPPQMLSLHLYSFQTAILNTTAQCWQWLLLKSDPSLLLAPINLDTGLRSITARYNALGYSYRLILSWWHTAFLYAVAQCWPWLLLLWCKTDVHYAKNQCWF